MKAIITFVLIGFSLILVGQENIDLFIFAGQSNALGYQGNADQYPVDSNNLDQKIRFNWKVPNGGNSGGWTTMGAQDIGHYFPDGNFGPEVTFSRKLLQAGYNPAIFKYSRIGAGFGYWLGAGEGGLYDDMISTLKTAIDTLEKQGHKVVIRGMVWIQGEGDSNNQPDASAYYEHLTTFIYDIRNNVVANPSLPILLGVDEQFFNDSHQEQHEILNTHEDIALNDDNIKFTSMYGYPKEDSTHLTPEGLISHGNGLFDSFQLLLSGEHPLEECVLSSKASHTSEASVAWGQSFTTDCSGMLSTIVFEAKSSHSGPAVFTLHNGADCSGTVLLSHELSSIEIGDNSVDLKGDSLYLDKEYSYFFDIVSNTNSPWQVSISEGDSVFGVLRCDSSGTGNCSKTFVYKDMDFSVRLALFDIDESSSSSVPLIISFLVVILVLFFVKP